MLQGCLNIKQNFQKELNFTKTPSAVKEAREPIPSTSEEGKHTLKMKEERVTKRSLSNRMVESLRGKEVSIFIYLFLFNPLLLII